MDKTKYIGMDVHKETISIAVLDSVGKPVMESIVETKAATILESLLGKTSRRSHPETQRTSGGASACHPS